MLPCVLGMYWVVMVVVVVEVEVAMVEVIAMPPDLEYANCWIYALRLHDVPMPPMTPMT